MCSRPGREETEEDLLQFQEEFLAAKVKASVKVVKGSGKSPICSNFSAATAGEKRPCNRDVVSLEGEKLIKLNKWFVWTKNALLVILDITTDFYLVNLNPH